ncbi:MAG: efflux RND transporter periplasmic adaptor subunit [Armatimonadetes bacterium]|nr:efflux RND transporter periplasmic adaptor subunit [Armatimonadota bacterium]
MRHIQRWILPILVGLQALLTGIAAWALPQAKAGPYRVTLVTRPETIPVGQADIVLSITDDAGKPVEDAAVRAIARMPGMPMGEREQIAAPGKESGQYVAPAVFPMAGGYEIAVSINGHHGSANATWQVKTGQNTALSQRGIPLNVAGLVVLLAVAGAFVIARMRATEQRVYWKGMLTKPVVTGMLLLIAGVLVAMFAVHHFRREGAMTPIEAQAMEMNTPAPPGVAPVVLAKVERRTITSAVRYTGQAVGYVEQDVFPRVTGVITWMPYYAGDRVKAGQLLARLDTTQIDPELQGREAALQVTRQGIGVAQSEIDKALRAAERARAEHDGARAAVAEAEANLAAAQQQRESASEGVTSAQAAVTDARAQVEAADADRQYWRGQIQRTAELLKAGAVSGEEYKRDKAQADTSEARVRQAQAQVQKAVAGVRTAQSALRASEAGVKAAQARLKQANTQQQVQRANIGEEAAGVEVARRKLAQAEATAAESRASVLSAATTKSYSRILAQTDGVVTQRLISPGVLASPEQAILKIAQISPIRLQVNVSEPDISRIRPGNSVKVQPKEGGKPLDTRVSSVSPALDPQSRMGVVEAIVPNEDHRFLPGSYVVMSINTGLTHNALTVPVEAIQYDNEVRGAQSKASQPYVWLAQSAPGGSLTAHRVDITTGVTDGQYTEILSGLTDGQKVITEGQDYLKEGDALVDSSEAPAQTQATQTSDIQTAQIEVLSGGYKPSSVTLRPGVRARLTFVRTSEVGCGTEVLIPAYDVDKPLPLNKPVIVEITPRKGEFQFNCGMNMLKGKLVVK